MATTYEQVGSVGTLVGAAMETAGHLAQSQILDALDKPEGQTLAGLIFLIAIMGAVITVAVGGNYKHGLWLLVGPVISAFLLTNRVPSDGPSWNFADRGHDQAEVIEANKGILQGTAAAGAGRAGKVSRVFQTWNLITSEIVQDMLRLLELTSDGSDLQFVAKTDRYIKMYSRGPNDPFFTALLTLGLNNKCGPYYSLLSIVISRDASPDRKEVARKQLELWGKDSAEINMKEFPEVRKWIKDTLKEDPGELMSCQTLWETAARVVKEHMTPPLIDHLVTLHKPKGLTAEQAKHTLLKKFGMKIMNGETYEDGTVSDGERLQYLINEVSARIIVKELSGLRPNLAAMEFDDHPGVAFGEAGRKMDQETARAIRSISGADEYQYKGELISAALLLPHIQGMALYFLAMSFPFFALVCILPGRQTAVLSWMGLWLWIKLWDFGMGVVMLLDNILYALLPHGTPLNNADLLDPGKAMNAIWEVDPTYSAHTYYNILACCMFAIPVATGFIVHRGGNELVSALSEGFREFPTMFGNSMASYQRSMMTQRNLGELQKHVYDETVASAWQATLGDAEISAAFKSVLDSKFGKNRANEILGLVGGRNPGKLQQALAGTGTDLAEIQSKAHDLLIRQKKGLAVAKLKANMNMAAYHASHSDYAVSRASQSVGAYMWNSHDIGQDVPGAELVNVEQYRHYNPESTSPGGGRLYMEGELRDLIYNKALKTVAGKDTPGNH